MERRLFIETFGLVTKQEKVASINQHAEPNTLILENTQPYPGYYSIHDADNEKPRVVYIVVKEKYPMQHILRLCYEAQEVLDCKMLDMTTCTVSIYAEVFQALRVRNLKNFGLLKDLQDFLRKDGISFQRYKPINDTATLEIQKLFSLEEIVDGIYQDLDEAGERYIRLPMQMSFSQFVRVTQAVKNNIEEDNFDAALGLFFRRKGIEDVVRIYEPFISVHNLEVIKKAYEDQIKRLKLQEI